nr:MAG TPA: hypothetical protein [Caudoviricetes sp.]
MLNILVVAIFSSSVIGIFLIIESPVKFIFSHQKSGH